MTTIGDISPMRGEGNQLYMAKILRDCKNINDITKI